MDAVGTLSNSQYLLADLEFSFLAFSWNREKYTGKTKQELPKVFKGRRSVMVYFCLPF